MPSANRSAPTHAPAIQEHHAPERSHLSRIPGRGHTPTGYPGHQRRTEQSHRAVARPRASVVPRSQVPRRTKTSTVQLARYRFRSPVDAGSPRPLQQGRVRPPHTLAHRPRRRTGIAPTPNRNTWCPAKPRVRTAPALGAPREVHAHRCHSRDVIRPDLAAAAPREPYSRSGERHSTPRRGRAPMAPPTREAGHRAQSDLGDTRRSADTSAVPLQFRATVSSRCPMPLDRVLSAIQ